MSSRDRILQAIHLNKPAFTDSPVMEIHNVQSSGSLLEEFIISVKNIGGTAVYINNLNDLKTDLQKYLEAGERIINTIPALGTVTENINDRTRATDLESVDKVFLRATLGVAENGAVWLEEESMLNRILPFICQDLKILLYADTIVADMHEAYRRISIDNQGYNVFIAGPSKTADIEQSLVIGAHGARSLQVYVLDSLQRMPE